MILICPAKPANKVKYHNKNEVAIISHVANLHCWQREEVSLYKFEIQLNATQNGTSVWRISH
jgi:hypothetical protein